MENFYKKISFSQNYNHPCLVNVLVLAGTLAQMDSGIWTVVDEIFGSYFAKIEFKLFFPRDWNLGVFKRHLFTCQGILIGAGMFINLTAAPI